MSETDKIPDRVEKGFQYLLSTYSRDRIFEIDLTELNMENGNNCIIAQLGGCEYDGTPEGQGNQSWQTEHGFAYYPNSQLPFFTSVDVYLELVCPYYDELTRVWRERLATLHE